MIRWLEAVRSSRSNGVYASETDEQLDKKLREGDPWLHYAARFVWAHLHDAAVQLPFLRAVPTLQDAFRLWPGTKLNDTILASCLELIFLEETDTALISSLAFQPKRLVNALVRNVERFSTLILPFFDAAIKHWVLIRIEVRRTSTTPDAYGYDPLGLDISA